MTHPTKNSREKIGESRRAELEIEGVHYNDGNYLVKGAKEIDTSFCSFEFAELSYRNKTTTLPVLIQGRQASPSFQPDQLPEDHSLCIDFLKPSDMITTIMDLLHYGMQRFRPFPVSEVSGRLVYNEQ